MADRPASARLLDRFAQYRRRAEREVEDPARVDSVAQRAQAKLKKHRGQLKGLRDDLPALIRLARAWSRGDYRAVPWRSLVLAVGALLYFVSPVDLVPDFIPILGFADDAAVVAFVLRAIRGDLETFVAWEERQRAPTVRRRLFGRRRG